MTKLTIQESGLSGLNYAGRNCFLIYLFILSSLISCKDSVTRSKGNGASETNKVEIRKENGTFRLFKNGKPFLVKGGAGSSHLPELKACGGNTIRTWDTVRLGEILDEANSLNLSVIVGLDIPKSLLLNEYYKKPDSVTQLITAYRSIVQRYKHHPSLLVWCLGNELDFPYRLKYASFYDAFNALLEMIHTEDPRHPVTTTLVNFERRSIVNLRLKIPDLDFISINTFNQLKTLDEDLKDFDWFWNGPYLVTEWSPEGGWETNINKWQAPLENTSTKKAEMFTEFYNKYLPQNDPRFMGSLAFYWGTRQEYTHTWFSIFNEDGYATEVKEALYDCWNDTITRHQSVKLKYMLVDDRGGGDNLLFAPGSLHRADILFPDNESTDSLQYRWEIIREDWWGHRQANWKKPPLETGLFRDSSGQRVLFTAPVKEGPYRIFVTVFNSKGYCATANTPFYVLE